MSSFPEEICIAILLRLPVKSTLVCKSVCKNWYALISEPDFVKSHHNLTIQKTDFRLMLSGHDTKRSRKVIFSLSYDPVSLSSDEFHLYGVEIIDWPLGSLDHDFQIMSSCNGLVCIWSRQKQLFCLWNPVNNEYKELPKSPNKPVVKSWDIFSYAFGYDSKTGDYKLICLYGHSGGRLVDVYTMGQNSWKTTQVIPYYVQKESGVLVNGVYHWLGQRLDDSLSRVIISLDISNEAFKELQLPTEPQCTTDVGVLKQCLSVLGYGVKSVGVEVWVMQDYGVQESWTLHYNITHEIIAKDPCFLRRLWSFNSGEILFAILGTPIDLILYDPKDGSARRTNIHVSGSDEYNSLRSLTMRDFQYLCGDNANYKNHSS